ncbi:MAG: hypothetical protein QXY50_01700 [Candidatus Caldarchaeum sp.]
MVYQPSSKRYDDAYRSIPWRAGAVFSQRLGPEGHQQLEGLPRGMDDSEDPLTTQPQVL